jgi:geranylgeranyl diphosphate synthase type II
VGRAYQAADDLQDFTSTPATIGKPTGQDAILGRPNLATELGIAGARRRLVALIDEAIAAVPQAPDSAVVRAWVAHLAARLRDVTGVAKASGA